MYLFLIAFCFISNCAIGVKDANKEDPDKVFDVLEKLLWNHPCEVRYFDAKYVSI